MEWLGRRTSAAGAGIVSGYTAACERAADPSHRAAFATFKRDPEYRLVLEHVTFEQGGRLLAHLAASAPWLLAPRLLRAFRENDAVGSPITYDYGPRYGRWSPTTLVCKPAVCLSYPVLVALGPSSPLCLAAQALVTSTVPAPPHTLAPRLRAPAALHCCGS